MKGSELIAFVLGLLVAGVTFFLASRGADRSRIPIPFEEYPEEPWVRFHKEQPIISLL